MRQGEAENCIIGQRAWICALRTKRSGSKGEPGMNVVHSPPPTMSGQMNGWPMRPAAIMSAVMRRKASQVWGLSWRRTTTGICWRRQRLRISQNGYLSA